MATATSPVASNPTAPTREDFAKFLAQETDKWTDVMKRANIKVSE